MKKIWVLIIIVIIITHACKQVYNAPINSPVTGYLVVEGFISCSAQSTTTIQLSRTLKLTDTVTTLYEHNANINIEGDGNETYPLSETGDGIYSSAPLSLNSVEKYRVHINTTDGKEYVSDFSPVKQTPAIDSVSWQVQDGGVQMYINTHDLQSNTKYYQWKFEETWEFHSTYLSSLKYVFDSVTVRNTGVTFRDPNSKSFDTTIFKCWQSQNSTNILIGSTEKLNSGLIYLPLNYIPPGDWRLSVLYSIKVKQYALSKQAYEFLQILKKNTEQLGSIFDAQPSQLKGNIHCTTNPGEIVIGFVEVSQEQQQRIFIKNSQLPDWKYSSGCENEMEIENNEDSILKKGGGLTPTQPGQTMGTAIVTFFAAQPRCVICTLRGTNVRPDFWP